MVLLFAVAAVCGATIFFLIFMVILILMFITVRTTIIIVIHVSIHDLNMMYIALLCV